MRRPHWPPVTAGTRYAVVFLFALTFLTSGTAYLLSASAIHRAAASTASVLQLCQAGNESRAQQVVLWTRIVAISQPPSHETVAQRRARLATVRAFIGYVRRLFAPRNCEHLKG